MLHRRRYRFTRKITHQAVSQPNDIALKTRTDDLLYTFFPTLLSLTSSLHLASSACIVALHCTAAHRTAHCTDSGGHYSDPRRNRRDRPPLSTLTTPPSTLDQSRRPCGAGPARRERRSEPPPIAPSLSPPPLSPPRRSSGRAIRRWATLGAHKKRRGGWRML